MLLNLGCGAERPGQPWVNVDDLFWYLGPDGSFGKNNPVPAAESLRVLRTEANYVNHNLEILPWPFGECSADGVFSCHCLEHLDCLVAVKFLRECYRIMTVNAVCRIVVPDASYHRKVYPEDSADASGNAQKLFGEPLGPGGHKSFMSYALFYPEHRQLLNEDSLWCEFVQAGFDPDKIRVAQHKSTSWDGHPWSNHMAQLDNRGPFSLRMEAMK